MELNSALGLLARSGAIIMFALHGIDKLLGKRGEMARWRDGENGALLLLDLLCQHAGVCCQCSDECRGPPQLCSVVTMRAVVGGVGRSTRTGRGDCGMLNH